MLVILILRPLSSIGAVIISALKNCVLSLMSIDTSALGLLPPKAAPVTFTGRCPFFSRNSKCAPISSSALNKGSIGLFFICSELSIVYCPSEKANIAVRNLAAVPALPTLITPSFLGILPLCPSMIAYLSTSFTCIT